jgi:hypothetical protein
MPEDSDSVKRHLDLVQSQLDWLRGQIGRYPPDHPKHRPDQTAMYKRLIVAHEDLLAFLGSLKERQLGNGWRNRSPHQRQIPGRLRRRDGLEGGYSAGCERGVA